MIGEERENGIHKRVLLHNRSETKEELVTQTAHACISAVFIKTGIEKCIDTTES